MPPLIAPFPPGPFSVLLADPPWVYRDKARAGRRGVEYKYDCLALDQITTLPVPAITADDAVCFLWATWPLLREALQTLAAWGFTYKTAAFVWVKATKHDKLFWGMGNYSRSGSEIVLLGVKGHPIRQSKAVHQIVRAPVREHSRKPDEVRQRIDALYPDGPRIELFARGVLPAPWVGWGTQYTATEPM